MVKPRIIAFVLAFREKPFLPLIALSKQTLKPSAIVIVAAYPSACIDRIPNIEKLSCLVVRPNMTLSVGERVGIALSVAFRRYRIEDYDYVIKLDDDVYFDERFLEANVSRGYDLIGCQGAVILKVDKILKVLNGRWLISPLDDALIIDLFRANGYKVLPWRWFRPPIYMRRPNDTFWRGIRFGVEAYRAGYPFTNLILNIIYKSVTINMRFSALLGMLIGYVSAFIRRVKRYPFSNTLKDFYRISFILNLEKKLEHLVIWIVNNIIR